jgi:ATP-dependent Clp protease ATP-binding subunit ClpA
VIENLPGFIKSASELGTALMEILEPALGGSAIQVIAFSDHASYHRDLEPNGKVTKFFEKIDIPEPTPERSLRMIEDVLAVLEPASDKRFMFQTLIRAVDLADRFIAEGAMPEKAIDLLNEAASVAGTGRTLIGPEDIEAVVKKRTNIPTGEAEGKEKEMLLHMEDLLRRRIVDQEHAVRAIADALRRARSGLKSTSRPIGSFLFLGPTGVGKTETAKALAEVYFGDKNAFIRFDMSEYQGEDGMKKLIGGYDVKEPGILSKRVREQPFSLLLFDEFEKASREVHNLFLQILDEGFFSDALGKRVSMRETMIIATSNAGTNLIWELLKEGKEFADIESRVINSIREERIFSIELLNRFDSMIVYHPLDRDQLQSVALLLLDELSRKLEVQEIHFTPTEELASRVAEIGYDPAFGARPMRRAIADRVEQIIAKKILAGELKRGDTFSFSKEDIAGL